MEAQDSAEVSGAVFADLQATVADAATAADPSASTLAPPDAHAYDAPVSIFFFFC